MIKLLTLVLPLMAAVPSQTQVETALGLPLENRIQAIQEIGPQAMSSIQEIAFNPQKPLKTRWSALIALSKTSWSGVDEVLQKALVSKEWYLRNAALVGLKTRSRQKAVKHSISMLDDPALVVRTAAVQTLIAVGGVESEKKLWKKLYAKENYRKGQSLWVRKHIAKALSKFARRGQEKRFIKILNDEDQRLHPYAIQGLRRLTGKTQDGKNLGQVKKAWLMWWKAQS